MTKQQKRSAHTNNEIRTIVLRYFYDRNTNATQTQQVVVARKARQ